MSAKLKLKMDKKNLEFIVKQNVESLYYVDIW